MLMEDNESCSSRVSETSPANSSRQQRQKVEVYNEVLRRLKELNNEEANQPGFEDELWNHFNRLPARYAFDVNVDRAEDVLAHKRLLHLAQDPANRPIIEVRLVQVVPAADSSGTVSHFPDSPWDEMPHNSLNRPGTHPPPMFGSSPNLEALALQGTDFVEDKDTSEHGKGGFSKPLHEITFSSDDKPKLLSQLTCLLAELGLNIQEAHAFSTTDGYSLDVFVVDGWPNEETTDLQITLEKKLVQIEMGSDSYGRFLNHNVTVQRPYLIPRSLSSTSEHDQSSSECGSDFLAIPNDGTDVWEIDSKQLKFENKIASGSYGDLFKGTYCSQEVAIKVLKPERLDSDLEKEFVQEVYIMRKVRHRNVVQFIGACTKPPTLCIVTEFMSGGSVYDYLHKQRGVFKLPTLLKVAIDISKGMNYLHQNNIIHRDLKAPNLLMDENEVVKVADFGVARVKTESGVMTAETGTYRWMSPEVIEHKPYDHKADVYSFGIVLWELLTGKLPYEFLTPLQAAVGVVQKGLRPTIPKDTHPKLSQLLERCWQQVPELRPNFSEIIEILQQIAKEVNKETERKENHQSSGGFLSLLRRGHH